MNLRDLKYLTALADHKHFGKAAKACFVSQPALSMQIKKLEDTLGIQLLERTHKSVLLTDVGKIIVQRAQEILIQAEAIREIARQTKKPEHGTLRLGIIPTLSPYLLTHIFPKLTLSFPHLEMHLAESKAHVLLKQLKQGKLDAALISMPVSDSQLTISTLFEEAFYLAAAERHPLAQKTTAQLSDLQNQTLLLLEEGHCLREQILNFCQNITIIKSLDVTDLETLRYMVASNTGITLMPALARRPESGITYLPFNPPPKLSRTIVLAWRNTAARSDLLQKIADRIRVILKEATIADSIFIRNP